MGIGTFFRHAFGISTPQAPAPLTPPPAANPPTLADTNVAAAGANQRAAALAASGMGFGDTVKNSGAQKGLFRPVKTGQPSLLG